MSHKILVCGGREYSNYEKVFEVLDREHNDWSIDVVIDGAARGADSLAFRWATERGVQSARCPANWDVYGKRAGAERNKAMLLLEPDLVIAFPGGRGTEHMIKVARNAGIDVRIIEED